jgi:hypothetical protein
MTLEKFEYGILKVTHSRVLSFYHCADPPCGLIIYINLSKEYNTYAHNKIKTTTT